MTKRSNRKFAISRRIGQPLWGDTKDPSTQRNYPPGAHGASGFKRVTEYGKQLLAKQKLKLYYGDIREKQFRSTYNEAVRKKGDTIENLIGLLESRLDSFVYRCGLAPTVFAARQFVTHKHVTVNGQVVNIPSYKLKAEDVVEVRDRSKNLTVIAQSLDKKNSVPDYVNFDSKNLRATYMKVPSYSEVPYPVEMNPNLVIEFYSR